MSETPAHPLRTGASDECGVFAVYARGEDVAKLCYYGLYALQHRGQESAGIAVSNGRNILVTKEMGLVNQVFDEARLAGMDGHLGIAPRALLDHRRVDLGQRAAGVQGDPVGDRPRARAQRQPGQHRRPGARRSGPSGDKCTTGLRAARHDGRRRRRRLAGGGARRGPASRPRGAFSLVVMDETTIYGARDPNGFRPLVIGRLPRGRLRPRLGDLGAGHRGRAPAARGRARRDRRHRLERAAQPPLRRGHAVDVPVRVRLRRPPRPPLPGDHRVRGPPADGRAARATRRRSTPTSSSRFPTPARRPPAGTPQPAASPTPRAWSRTATSAVPSSSRRSRCGSSASGSSSTPCRTSSRASAWSSSTTPSCAATRRGSWSRCCASPVRQRGPPAHHRAADPQPLLLRHRHGDPRRAHRLGPDDRGDPRLRRRRLAGVPVPGRAGLDHAPAQVLAVPRVLRRRVPDPGPARSSWRRARTCSHRTADRDHCERRGGTPTPRRGSTSTPPTRRSSGSSAHVARTARPEVLEGIGGFGGLFALPTKGLQAPGPGQCD